MHNENVWEAQAGLDKFESLEKAVLRLPLFCLEMSA